MFESSYEINTSDKLLVNFSVHLACFALHYHQIETPNQRESSHVQKDASLRFSRIDDVAGVRRRLPAPAHG